MAAPHDRIYILLAADDLVSAERSGNYRAASLATEGFIHASRREHLPRVANKYYSSASDLRMMHIDPERVRAEIRWEPASGSIYPHIYGPLNMDAVERTSMVARGDNGDWAFDDLDE